MKKLLMLTQGISDTGCMTFNVDANTYTPFMDDITIYINKLSDKLEISETEAQNFYLNALYGDLNSNGKPSFQKIDKDTMLRTLIFEGQGLFDIIKSCYKDLKTEISEGFNDLGFDPYQELFKKDFIDEYGEENLQYFNQYMQNKDAFIDIIKNYGSEGFENWNLYLNDKQAFIALMNSDKFPETGVVLISDQSMNQIPDISWYNAKGKRVEDLFDFEFIGDILNNAEGNLFIINIEKIDDEDLESFVGKKGDMKYFSINEEVSVPNVEVTQLNLV